MGPLDRKVEWVFLVQSAYNSSRVILVISLSSFKQRQTRLKRVAFAGLSYPRILIAGTLSIQKNNNNKTKTKQNKKNNNKKILISPAHPQIYLSRLMLKKFYLLCFYSVLITKAKLGQVNSSPCNMPVSRYGRETL